MGGSSFPGQWSFKYHPWLKEMHDSEATINIGQKAAQMGFTELVLNLVFFQMDIKGSDCLYILPSKTPDASDFSASRFDSAVELSPHLERMFSDVKNVGHKRAGSANLYIRGSQSKSGLKSIPVSFIVMDEVAEMNQENIALALERTSGQRSKLCWKISTPTVENLNINRDYNLSSKEEFFFTCPSCSRHTHLVFPDCLKIVGENILDPRIVESHLICKECQNILPQENKWEWLESGFWVPAHKERADRGFHISQLYSSTVTPAEIAKSYFKSLSDPTEEQELYNSKLGLCHTVEGARISDKIIDDCISEHHIDDNPPSDSIITMGVDVGPKWNHFWIDQWFLAKNQPIIDLNMQTICKTLKYGKVQTFGELYALMLKYNVRHCIIDAQPERRLAREFAMRFYGLVHLCFYGKGITGKCINVDDNPVEPKITVDRTSWLDQSLGRFHQRTIRLPMEIDQEFRDHMKALVRVYQKDSDGNPVGAYVKGENDPDHYAHARNYSEIALNFAYAHAGNQNIRRVI